MIRFNKNGFTLVEMMIVLLIMCVVVAVSAPVMTTRMKSSGQNASPVWKYIENSGNSDIYFGTKDLQRVVIGQNNAETAENARLIINTSADTPNHIIFKDGGNYAGMLKLSSNGSIAIGNGAEASLDYSTAIGYGAKALTPNTIVLGTDRETVNIPGSLLVQSTSYPSDRRLKYVGKESNDGLDKLRKLKVYNYIYKKDVKKVPHVGVIAQDLQKVFPNAVKKGSDGFLSIRTDDMFYALINSVKELDAKISTLLKYNDDKELRIKKLEEENKALEQRIKALESKIK